MSYRDPIDLVNKMLVIMEDHSALSEMGMHPYDHKQMLDELCDAVEDYQEDTGTYDTGYAEGYALGFSEGRAEGYEDAAADVRAALDSSY